MNRYSLPILVALFSAQICQADLTYSEELKAQAEQGNMRAQAQLAWCYNTGTGIEQNYEKAFEWYSRSAEQGYGYAMNNIGLLYKSGNGVTIDFYQAVKWFEKAYANQYTKAEENLKKFLLPESIFGNSLIHQAESGDAEAQYVLAYSLWSRIENQNWLIIKIEDDKIAFELMQKAAEAGHIDALYDLGIFYYEGKGIAKDSAKAYECFLKAAKAGNSKAQYNVGLWHAKGLSGETSDEEAIYWMHTAANNGNGDAMFELGVYNEKGLKGLPKDLEKAVEWYKKGAKANAAEAWTNLGFCYFNGFGVEKNFWKAVECYGQAASMGNEIAQNNLSMCVKDIAKKFPKYFKELKLKAIEGDVDSQARVGLYYMGNVPGQYKIDNLPYLKEAAKWVLEAAENGYADFQYLAGDIYETGNLTPVNVDKDYSVTLASGGINIEPIDYGKARKFYELSANSEASNNWMSQYRLGKAYYNGEDLVDGTIDYDKGYRYLQSMVDKLEKENINSAELKEAYELLSKCYYMGRGVQANPEKGELFMKKSARYGNAKPYQSGLIGPGIL